MTLPFLSRFKQIDGSAYFTLFNGEIKTEGAYGRTVKSRAEALRLTKNFFAGRTGTIVWLARPRFEGKNLVMRLRFE